METIEELHKEVQAKEHDAEDKRRNKEQVKILLACLHIKGDAMTAVKLEDARRVISAAEKKAREIAQPTTIALADEGGNIVAHVRMDNAWIGSIDISMKKASTSRAFDIETKELAKHAQSGDEFLRHSCFKHRQNHDFCWRHSVEAGWQGSRRDWRQRWFRRSGSCGCRGRRRHVLTAYRDHKRR